MSWPKPIVIERDRTKGRPVWRVFVRGAPVVRDITARPNLCRVAAHPDAKPLAFRLKSDAENVAQFIGRYQLKLGDMVAFHVQYTERQGDIGPEAGALPDMITMPKRGPV